MEKLIALVLGTSTVEAGPACDIVWEYRCSGTLYQRRQVQIYGNKCQYRKPISGWQTVGRNC